MVYDQVPVIHARNSLSGLHYFEIKQLIMLDRRRVLRIIEIWKIINIAEKEIDLFEIKKLFIHLSSGTK